MYAQPPPQQQQTEQQRPLQTTQPEIWQQQQQTTEGEQHQQERTEQQGQLSPQEQQQQELPSQTQQLQTSDAAALMVDVEALRYQVEVASDLVLYTMKRQKRKDAWHFARLIRNDTFRHLQRDELNNSHAEQVYCLLCDTTFKFSVGQSKVAPHMETYHPVELNAHAQQAEQAARGNGRSRSSGRGADDERKKKLRKITPQQQVHLNKLLAAWIAHHFRPMIIVEDEGFIAVIRYITEDISGVQVSLPERTKISQEIVALAVEYRKRVKLAMKVGCLYFSITCDIWTARNSKSYISVTVHYVDNEFCPQSWTLEVKELPGMHDGAIIAATIEQILEDWSLLKSYCVRFVRDGGSNMVSTGNKLRVKHMACLAHCLHLVVGGAMIKKKRRSESADEPEWAADVAAESSEVPIERDEESPLTAEDRTQLEGMRDIAINDMEHYLDETIASLQRNELDAVRAVVQRFHTLAVYFRKSPKGNNRLSALQVDNFNVKAHEVKKTTVDCATRWNSCWQMLERMIELEGVLVKFFAYLKKPEGRKEFKDVAKKLRRPTAEEWLTIKCLQTLLGPFAVASETLSGQEYPTVPLVLPTLSGIRKHLERSDLFAGLAAEAGDEYVTQTVLMMNECRAIMLGLYKARFDELEKSELRWVAFLDPRVGKWMSHLSAADTPAASNELVDAIVELAQPNLPGQQAERRSNTPVQVSAEQHRSFMHHHMFGPDTVPTETTDIVTECKKEFARYLESISSVKSGTNPFWWCKVNEDNYPNLRKLARKWLGAVATSVPSERAFSTSGNILTVKRSSLKPTMVRDLVFMAENWKGINALRASPAASPIPRLNGDRQRPLRPGLES
ncbi:hypothetical protein PF010_g5015 [Phytophthora fragariae]|uniref:HAT C-terminal dimerisation domain-containing protein n=1 Tax=Phytophthora fragariae TaxID=53985 RepID=A0A6A3ZD39_9STRA|nr:hypothetical protein PF003_g24689 [Phytophthora fragariae]KAE9127150.1 hypothetical protein PF010_g5015 [Phytophthora fragariae]KAE9234613.1 hypothetical protein PF002_g11754 [Phytophthora fragariae]